ncbi:MAG: polysaccharide pyruvyl transferase family protein [Candidatus Thiodiazotropha sp.]
MIVVLHAYSRGNRGDGLLVDLTIELIRCSVPSEDIIKVVAVDAKSFCDLDNVISAPNIRDNKITQLLTAIFSIIKIILHISGIKNLYLNNISKELECANLIVGVGGGYLRSGRSIEGLKSLVVHATQLLLTEHSKSKTIYLPQSIGPLRGMFGSLLRRSIKSLDIICLRDNRSINEIGWHKGVRRFPDLAVMKIAKMKIITEKNYERIYLIARDISGSSKKKKLYRKKIKYLKKSFPDLIVVLQSEVRGNSDTFFYKELGWGEDFKTLKCAIDEYGRGIVISVRLHGSLESIMLGCPSIHLSYERKGYGAYEDLNLKEYVHNVNDFDVQRVSDQVLGLKINAEKYWEKVSEAVVCIERYHENLTKLVSENYRKSVE